MHTEEDPTDTTVLNPKTMRRVHRAGKVGVAVLAAAEEIERIRARVYLDQNILNAIAVRCDSPTRRVLAQVDRDFMAMVRVGTPPTRGRVNAAHLTAFLEAQRSLTVGSRQPLLQLVAREDGAARLDVTVHCDADGSNLRAVLWRVNRPNREPSDLIGMLRYTDIVGRDVRLADVVKRRKRRFMSDFLETLGGVFYSPPSDALRAWQSSM